MKIRIFFFILLMVPTAAVYALDHADGIGIAVKPEAEKGISVDASSLSACDNIIALQPTTPCLSSQGTVVRRSSRHLKTVMGQQIEISGTEVNGRFWSDTLKQPCNGLFQNIVISEKKPDDKCHVTAEEACKALGLALPTKWNFRALKSAFEVNQESSNRPEFQVFAPRGAKEFHNVMPDALGQDLWSATEGSLYPYGDALKFNGTSGLITTFYRGMELPVRCTDR